MARWHAYAVLLVLAAVALGVVAARAARGGARPTERFEAERVAEPVQAAEAAETVEPAAAAGAHEPFDGGRAAGDAASYDARMYVMRVFENALGRRPTPEELHRYSALQDEARILRAIVRDTHGGRNVRGHGLGRAAQPYSPCGDDDSCSSSGGEDGEDVRLRTRQRPRRSRRAMDNDDRRGRVCLDRTDVLARLQKISAEVRGFRDLVAML